MALISDPPATDYYAFRPLHLKLPSCLLFSASVTAMGEVMNLNI